MVRILIVGAGAVGTFYASRFDQHAAHVALVCRSNYEAVKAHGFTMKTHSFGEYVYKPHAVYPSVPAAAGDAWEYVVIATKALQMDASVADFLAPVVSPTTTLVVIQNGVEIEAPYRARYPTTPIISAVTVMNGALIEPTVMVQNRWTRISLGPYTNFLGTADTDEELALRTRAAHGTEELAALWTQGGLRDAETHDAQGLQLVRWHKLSINASINASGVLAGCVMNDHLVQDPVLRAHIAACMQEVLDAAPQIFGRPLPEKMAKPDVMIASIQRNIASKSSMVQDWEARRPLELDAILGNALRVAERHGAQMPRLQTMYALLQSAQKKHLDTHA